MTAPAAPEVTKEAGAASTPPPIPPPRPLSPWSLAAGCTILSPVLSRTMPPPAISSAIRGAVVVVVVIVVSPAPTTAAGGGGGGQKRGGGGARCRYSAAPTSSRGLAHPRGQLSHTSRARRTATFRGDKPRHRQRALGPWDVVPGTKRRSSPPQARGRRRQGGRCCPFGGTAGDRWGVVST